MDFLPRVLRRENYGAVSSDKTMARTVIVAQSEVDSHDPQKGSVETLPLLGGKKVLHEASGLTVEGIAANAPLVSLILRAMRRIEAIRDRLLVCLFDDLPELRKFLFVVQPDSLFYE